MSDIYSMLGEGIQGLFGQGGGGNLSMGNGMGGLFSMAGGGSEMGGYRPGSHHPGVSGAGGNIMDYDPFASGVGSPGYEMAGGGIPKPPNDPFKWGKPGDVSGFVDYGMQAPQIADPTQQIQGLMGMALAGDPHRAAKEDPFMQMPQGGLMQYLMSLGAL